MRSFFSGLRNLLKRDPLPMTQVSREKLARFCCHAVAKPTDRVEAFGEHTDTTMPKNEQGGYDFCHACLGRMAICCAWCDRPIFVGDPVTLYMPSNPFVWFSSRGAYMTLDKNEMVGCGRSDCAETGADYAGFWVPACVRQDGRWVGGVKRMPSMYQVALANNGGAVINDAATMSNKPLLPGVQVPERMPAYAAVA